MQPLTSHKRSSFLSLSLRVFLCLTFTLSSGLVGQQGAEAATVADNPSILVSHEPTAAPWQSGLLNGDPPPQEPDPVNHRSTSRLLLPTIFRITRA